MVGSVEYREKSSVNDNAAALASVLNTSINTVGGIIEWLLKAGMSSPILAGVSGLLVANILYRAKAIDQSTLQLVNIIITASMAVDLTAETISAFTDILPFAPKANTTAGASTATTLVFGTENNAQLNALLSQLAVKK